MAQTFPVHEPEISHVPPPPRISGMSNVWSKVKLGVKHSFFWAYERGSWQYDLIVTVILAFIFLTPRAWFNDRPTFQLSDLRHQQGIIELSRVDKTVHYLIDSRLLESLDMKPEDAIRVILSQHVMKPFKINSTVAVWDRNHKVILGYNVEVQE